MSEENIEAIKRVYEAFNRADFDAALALADPQIELVRLGGLAPLTGPEALRAWLEPDAFDTQAAEPLDFRDAGNKVLVQQRLTAQGAESGIEIDIGSWSVWTLSDDGLVTRLEMFLDSERDDAFEAAGMSP